MQMHDFMPHGHCIFWDPALLSLHVISDILIFLSYCSIPAAIWYYCKRREVSLRLVPALFICFILSCAITHIFTIWNWWNNDYWVSGAFKAFCAIVSTVTAIVLWYLMPKALALPTSAEMTALNNELADKVRERTKTLDALEKQKNINLEQTNFLASVAHEIRNYLNIIEGGSGVLNDNDFEKSKDVLPLIHKNAKSLNRLINDVLDLSKVESGNLTIEYSSFNIKTFIEEIASHYRSLLARKNIELKVLVENHLPSTIISDELRMGQVLHNLLNNAEKYTESGQVLLEVKSKPMSKDSLLLCFDVHDTGSGIPEKDQPNLFKYFTRSAVHQTIEGVGIGLALSKNIAHLLGGDLSLIKSNTEGSSFHFELECEVSAREIQKIQMKKNGTFKWPNKKVLIADDSKENLVLYTIYLQKTQLEISYAQTGREALALYQTQDFDIVMLDIEMPEVSGLEVMRFIKDQKASTAVVAATGNGLRNYKEKLEKDGFDHVLTKPFSHSELIEAFAKYL